MELITVISCLQFILWVNIENLNITSKNSDGFLAACHLKTNGFSSKADNKFFELT